jgi:hypothetical protein
VGDSVGGDEKSLLGDKSNLLVGREIPWGSCLAEPSRAGSMGAGAGFDIQPEFRGLFRSTSVPMS